MYAPKRKRRREPSGGVEGNAAIPEVPTAERLLERDGDLRETAAALERARDGDGLPLLIEGPPGIGKTRLLQAVSEQAALGGFRVQPARATELEREFPFGLVRQLFEPGAP